MGNSSDKMDQIKALENGRGLQYLLDEAYKIFGNPILLHDMEYKIIALNEDVVTDDPIWLAYAENRAANPELLDFFKHECFLEAAANTNRITFLKSNQLKYDRIYGKVFNKNNIQVGCSVLMENGKPFEYEDPKLFEVFCEILTAELGKSDFYNEYGQVYFEQLVDELIAGIDDVALYTAHVESIYMHLKSNLYLAAVDIGACDPTYAQTAYYRDLFKKTQPEYSYAVYANYILIIIGLDNQMLSIEKDLNSLNQLFHAHNIYAGISSVFENLFELNKYYQEALGALNNGPAQASQPFFFYDRVMPAGG